MNPNNYHETLSFNISAFLIFEEKANSLQIKKREYAQQLLKAFSQTFPGVYNCKDFYVSTNDKNITFRVFCAVQNDVSQCKKKWILKCAKDISIQSKVLVRVFEENRECKHADNIMPRPLRITGSLRSEIAERMKNESNIQLISSFIQSALPSQLEAGNSRVPTLNALQTLRSRKFCSLDLDGDDHVDMIKRSLKSNEYIRRVTSPTFSATLCKETQIKVLEKWCRENSFRRAYLDATGNIVRKISGQHNVLHHVLLIQVHVANDKGATAFNLAELITTSQTAQIISDFLKCFLRFADETSTRKMMWFHEIITDKSFANIGAILQAFNEMTLSRYLEVCWKLLSTSDKKAADKLVVVRLCSSHTTKTMMDDIRKHFKDKKLVSTICSIIGKMFNIRVFENLLKFIEQVLFSFMSPFCGPAMEQIRQESVELLRSMDEHGPSRASEPDGDWSRL